MTSKTQTYRQGTTTSRDGTIVGYREMGDGPALLLLHGGMMAAQNFMTLGTALSRDFKVIIPDRRGRGTSGEYGRQYTLMRDVEDIDALMKQTGASGVFGLSSGAIIALQSALTLSGIHRVAAFEPPLAVPGFDPARWADKFERGMAKGDLALAMVAVMKGTGDSELLKLVPDFLLATLLRLGIRADAGEVKPGDTPIRELIPTMHYDVQIVNETRGLIPKLRDLKADVLLLGGSRSAAFLKGALNQLSEVLPNANRVEISGVGHLAADNEGKPEMVADALRRFFRADHRS